YIDGAEDVRIASAPAGDIALQMVRDQRPDCIVLNPAMPGLNPATMIDEVQKQWGDGDLAVPIIVYGDERAMHDGGTWQRTSKMPTLHWVHSLERLPAQRHLCFARN